MRLRPTPETAAPTAEPSDAPALTTEPSTAVDTDDYVVTFAPGTGAAERARILAAAGADVVDTIASLRMAVVRVADGTSVVADLRAEPAVSRVELDRVRATEAGPSDRLYRRQWSLPHIRWDDVYRSVDPSGSAVVAVLDTGVDAAHPDLAGQLVEGTSLVAGADETDDPNGHGTAMAGIVAAATDNGIGIAGIGFDGVRVMPVTVLDADGLGQDSDIIEGIVWAVDHGADVVNLSFSNPGYSAALQAAVDYAWARDVVVVAATGNDGSSAATYPAGDRGVIGVSNTDRSDALHPTSNHGAATFLGAPGTGISTLRAGGGTTTVTGTSASAAEVSAAAALLRAIDPDASNGVIVGRLARSAAAAGSRSETGNGRLDLARAVRDNGTGAVTPAGVAPGTGGPFVGPYVAAAASVNATTTLNGSTGSITVSQGVSITMVMSVTTAGNGQDDDWDASRWAFATTPPAAGAMTCVDHANHNGDGTYTETMSIAAPATAGTYDLYLYAYNESDCVTGQSTLFVRAGALTVTADTAAPTATIDLRATSDSGGSSTDDITNAATLTYDVTFSESVTGLAAGDFSNVGTATGCTISAPTGSGAAYAVSLTGCSAGTVILRLAAGGVTDPASNANAQTDGPTVTIDRTAPTVIIDLQAGSDNGPSSTDNVTNATTLVFDVTFNEPVTGLAATDFSEQGTATGCVIPAPAGSGAAYTETLTACTAGSVILRLAASAVTDTAGNTNALTNGPTITVDRTAPTATLDLQAGSDSGSSTTDNITNATNLVYSVTFSETVTGLAAADFSNVGTAAGCAAGAPTGSGAAYTVTLTGCGQGTVVLRLAAGGVTDTAGNGNAQTNGPTVTVDRTGAVVIVDLRAASDSGTSTTDNITNAATLVFDISFGETVTGVAAADFSRTGTATGCALALAGSGATRTVTLTACSAGTVILTFLANGAVDTAGNLGPTANASLTVTVDRTAPTVTINQAVAQVDPTGTSPIDFTVVFSEAVSGFATGDVTVGGTSGGTKTGTVTGGPTTFNVAVTGMTTSGTVVASIAASRATDTAGNNNTASTSTDNTVTWDSVAPTVTVNQALGQVDPANTSPITFTVVFSEAVFGFATGDVTISGTAGGTKTAAVFGSGTTYTVSVTGMTTPGTVVASIAAGVATDSAGNGNQASTSSDDTVSWDDVAPTATIDLQAGSDSGASSADDVTNAASLTFDITFSEPVLGFGAGDLSNVGTAAGCAVGAPSGSGVAYSVTVTGCSDGTVVLRLAAGGVTDAAANSNAQTDGPTVTVDRTGPTVTIDQAPSQSDPTNVSPITFRVVFSEPVAGFTNGDVSITGSSGGLKSAAVSGSGASYDVDITGMTTSGTVVASIAAASAVDAAGNPSTASTSSDNTVTWDRATHLAFVQHPTDTVYGSTISPAVTVAVLDASDQLVTESTTSVSLTLTPVGPTVGGTVSAPVIGGIATFSDLTIDAVGTYTLIAQSPGLFSGVSTPFQITPAPLTVTAQDRSKVYGQTAFFAGTEFTTSGLQGGDTVSFVTLTSAGAPAAATVAGGPYAITPSAAIGSGLSNYTITYVDGTLTVLRAFPTVVVTGYSVTYDALPHTATGSATGAFGEDLSADLDLSATTHTAVGTYSDPWTFIDMSGNYLDRFGSVADDIAAAALTVIADDRTKTYGQTVVFAGTEFSVSGLLGSDTVDSVTLTSAGAAATATVAGSTYPIVASAAVGSGTGNYTITYVDGALTVDPASLTITADDQSKPFGVDFVFGGTEFSTNGLVNGDTVDVVSLASAGAPAAAAPGNYPITAGAATGSGLANYTIAYVNGTLTVGNTTPTIGDADVTTGATMPVDGSVTVSDPDTAQTVTLAISSGPSHGTAALAQDGSFTFTPAGTYTGPDTFTIEGCDDHVPSACATGTVTIAIHPIAIDDEVDVVSEGGTVEVDVQANDIGDASELTIVSGPDHGTARVGSIIYTPDPDYAGTDQVVYRVCSPNDPALCDDGTLTITVSSAGDAPETDTESSLGASVIDLPREVLPPLVIVLLAIVAVLGGAAVTKRRRSPSR
jgi:hypothetical protein